MNLFDLLNEEVNVIQEQIIVEVPKKEIQVVAATQEIKADTNDIIEGSSYTNNEATVLTVNGNSEDSNNVVDTIVETSIEDTLSLKATTEKKSEKKDSKDSKKASSNTTSSLKGDAKIQEDCKKCSSITVKYFGNEIFTIDDADEIAKISLKEIAKSLVQEYNYQEFASGVSWYLANGTDKTQGFLVATLKNFGSKG